MPSTDQSTRNLLQKSMMTNVVLSIVVVILVAALVFQYVSGPKVIVANVPVTTTASNTTTTVQNVTGTLANIDQPFNASQLSVFNNAPLGNFEIAGGKLLNGTLDSEVQLTAYPQYNALIINGKPTVVYIGAITCPFCSENRWAMALALGQFGSFQNLYYGYSALHDGDVPTLYWGSVNYTTPEGVNFNNSYSSQYINFISADYESPVSGSFQVQPISYFISKAPNPAVKAAMSFMNATNKFQGTPFTLWGTSLVPGADAVVVVNDSWTGMAALTHRQIINQINGFNGNFSYAEFAAADVYIAQLCRTLSQTNSSAPQVCSLPAIVKLEALVA